MIDKCYFSLITPLISFHLNHVSAAILEIKFQIFWLIKGPVSTVITVITGYMAQNGYVSDYFLLKLMFINIHVSLKTVLTFHFFWLLFPQLRQQLDDTRRVLSTTKTQHVLQLEQVEVWCENLISVKCF